MPALSYSQARAEFRAVLDEASRGGTTTITRGDTRAAITDATRLRTYLAATIPPTGEVVLTDGLCTILIPDLGLSSESAVLDEAVDDMVDALYEYADEWPQLAHAPSHRDNWAVVQLVHLSTPAQLRDWLLGT